MKKRMIFPRNDVFPQNNEDSIDSIFHWRRKYDESVDKWVHLDSLLMKVMRESEEKDRQIAFLKDAHDAIRELAYKTGVEEEREACERLVWSTPEPDDEYVSHREAIAAAIRARGEV